MPVPGSTVDRARTRRTGVVLFLLTAVVYLATAGYERAHIDVVSANVGGWRIASTGQPWVEDVDLERINRADADLFTTTHAGHEVIARSPGVVAVVVPAYAVRQLLTGAGPAEEDFSNAPGAATAALLAAGGVLLMWGALTTLTTRRRATLAAVVLAFGTPVWSVAADGTWTHTLTVLAIAGMAFAAARERWLLVGLFGGIGAWGRLHTVLIAAAVALACAFVHRRPRIVLEVGAAGAALTAVASLWTQWLYGRWIPTGGYAPADYGERQEGASNDFDHGPLAVLQNELGLWVAPDRGILVWTPVALVLAPLVVRTWREQPVWARAMLGGGLVYTLLQGWLNVFHGGDGIYGYRLTLELLVCAAPSLVIAALRAGRLLRVVLTALVGLQLAAFALGGTFNRPTLTVDRAWTDNAFVHALSVAPLLLLVLAALVAGTFLATRLLTDMADEPTRDLT